MPRRRRSWPATLRRLLFDVVTLAGVAVTSRSRLAAENLFCVSNWHSTKSAASSRDGRIRPREWCLSCSHACWTGVRF